MPFPCFVPPLLVFLCAHTHPAVTPGATQDPAHSREPASTPTPTTPTLLVATAEEIWNGAVRPGKTDHWGAYPAEFEGLCRFLGALASTSLARPR
jgi:hypothetical protein